MNVGNGFISISTDGFPVMEGPNETKSSGGSKTDRKKPKSAKSKRSKSSSKRRKALDRAPSPKFLDHSSGSLQMLASRTESISTNISHRTDKTAKAGNLARKGNKSANRFQDSTVSGELLETTDEEDGLMDDVDFDVDTDQTGSTRSSSRNSTTELTQSEHAMLEEAKFVRKAQMAMLDEPTTETTTGPLEGGKPMIGALSTPKTRSWDEERNHGMENSSSFESEEQESGVRLTKRGANKQKQSPKKSKSRRPSRPGRISRREPGWEDKRGGERTGVGATDSNRKHKKRSKSAAEPPKKRRDTEQKLGSVVSRSTMSSRHEPEVKVLGDSMQRYDSLILDPAESPLRHFTPEITKPQPDLRQMNLSKVQSFPEVPFLTKSSIGPKQDSGLDLMLPSVSSLGQRDVDVTSHGQASISSNGTTPPIENIGLQSKLPGYNFSTDPATPESRLMGQASLMMVQPSPKPAKQQESFQTSATILESDSSSGSTKGTKESRRRGLERQEEPMQQLSGPPLRPPSVLRENSVASSDDDGYSTPPTDSESDMSIDMLKPPKTPIGMHSSDRSLANSIDTEDLKDIVQIPGILHLSSSSSMNRSSSASVSRSVASSVISQVSTQSNTNNMLNVSAHNSHKSPEPELDVIIEQSNRSTTKSPIGLHVSPSDATQERSSRSVRSVKQSDEEPDVDPLGEMDANRMVVVIDTSQRQHQHRLHEGNRQAQPSLREVVSEPSQRITTDAVDTPQARRQSTIVAIAGKEESFRGKRSRLSGNRKKSRVSNGGLYSAVDDEYYDSSVSGSMTPRNDAYLMSPLVQETPMTAPMSATSVSTHVDSDPLASTASAPSLEKKPSMSPLSPSRIKGMLKFGSGASASKVGAVSVATPAPEKKMRNSLSSQGIQAAEHVVTIAGAAYQAREGTKLSEEEAIYPQSSSREFTDMSANELGTLRTPRTWKTRDTWNLRGLSKRENFSWKIIAAIVIAVLLVVIVVLAVTRGAPDPSTYTPNTEATPTAAPTPEGPALSSSEIEVLIMERARTERSTLFVDSTAPSRAFAWLASPVNSNYFARPNKLVQRYVLASFYYSTNGNSWEFQDGWLSAEDECGWFSTADVFCDREGFITNLDMRYNDLVGSLPSELVGLPRLSSIDLSGNRMYDFLPPLGLAPMLKRLVLDENEIMMILPTEIGVFRKLEILSLNQNRLAGPIPSEIRLLTSLKVLSLASNFLGSSIPNEITSLRSLEQLNLQENDFGGSLPSTLGALSFLTDLGLGHNTLTGSIPTQLGALRRLRKLDLSHNRLESFIVSEIGQLNQLRIGWFQDNDFIGPIPVEIVGLGHLKWLDISQNQLQGTIPSRLTNLVQLEQFVASENFLTGTIPNGFNDGMQLSVVDLHSNQLTGPIPADIASLYLEQLDLSFNIQLRGTIPMEILQAGRHGIVVDLVNTGVGGIVECTDAFVKLEGTVYVNCDEVDCRGTCCRCS